MSDNWIRVSEVVEYVYCRRSWWLRRMEGHASANVTQLAHGSGYHNAHGRRVRLSLQLRLLAYGLLLGAAIALLFSLL
jgi:CRISPR/Cas system-associated exonuclease Cas4 (RecB family)